MSYSTSFYKNRTANTSEASNIILKNTSKSLDNINSIFDIGCGSGAWLETAEDIFKADKLIGLEGEWLPKEILNKFINKNILIKVGNLNSESFLSNVTECDLIICLEVLEHLKENTVRFICDHIFNKARYILFSAALPYQGGNGHITEKPLSFYVDLMNKNGYGCNNKLSELIWNNNKIPYWYRQNIVLFEKGAKNNMSLPIDIVHPDCLRSRAKPSFSQSLYHFKNKIKSFWPNN